MTFPFNVIQHDQKVAQPVEKYFNKKNTYRIQALMCFTAFEADFIKECLFVELHVRPIRTSIGKIDREENFLTNLSLQTTTYHF